MTSLLFWKTRSFRGAPPRKCCHGNSKGSTLKLLPFNKFLYIFRKSHQIWLNYLPPSLSYGQKTSRMVPNTPLGRIGLNYSLKALFRLPGGRGTHAGLETVQNQLTIREVFKTIEILRSLELLYMRSTLRVDLSDVFLELRQFADHFSSSSLDYYEYLN